MFIPKINMNIMKKFALCAIGASTSLAGLNSCWNGEIRINKEISEKVDTSILKKPLDADIYCPTKPNLPVMEGDSIVFRNTQNKLIKIKDDQLGFISTLYKSIQQYATKEQPNIEDVENFYMSVESKFPKGFLFEQNLERAKVYTHQYEVVSNLFNRLYQLTTAETSEKGKTITVEEYTRMMEAWSTLGNGKSIIIALLEEMLK